MNCFFSNPNLYPTHKLLPLVRVRENMYRKHVREERRKWRGDPTDEVNSCLFVHSESVCSFRFPQLLLFIDTQFTSLNIRWYLFDKSTNGISYYIHMFIVQQETHDFIVGNQNSLHVLRKKFHCHCPLSLGDLLFASTKKHHD